MAFILECLIPKDGRASPGVKRQYSGTLGKIGNCQIGTSLHAVGERGTLPLGWRVPASTIAPVTWIDPAGGPVGTPLTLRGKDFPAGQQVRVTWSTHGGNDISAGGVVAASTSIATVTTAQDGSFEASFNAPLDLQGAHEIEAISGSTHATTSFAISPSLEPLTPSSGPPGTWFTVHLKGTGWTNTSNIYSVDYDNSFVGYGCGINSKGDITIHLQAAGAPGWHFITLYPGIYTGTDEKYTSDFNIPQLTIADHPEEHLPSFELAFRVT